MTKGKQPKLMQSIRIEGLMKAIVYTQYGSPDVLSVQEVDKPVPKDNELLIKVHAAEVTKADCEMRSFNFPVKWFWLPLRIALGITKPKNPILGGYFAGEVASVGKAVSTHTKGDWVFGAAGLQMGAYGEYLCLPDSHTVVPKPSTMSCEEAAAVPLGGLNALHFFKRAKVNAGDRVLINGAGGSIGIFGVQIAKSMGAEVTAVDSAIKEGMLRSIGVDHFINYEQQDFRRNGQYYDVIFDMVARSSYSGCIKSLAPNGRYLIGNPRVSDMLRSVLSTRFTDKTVMFAFAGEKKEELLALKDMIEEGVIGAVIDKVFPMEQAAEAHRRVETEQRVGSIVLAIGSNS